MSDLLNITTPVAPKNYDFSPKNNPQQSQTDQVFNLGDTTKVQKSTEREQEYTNQDNKDGSVLNTDITPAKDPAAGINVLRSIIGEETLAALRESGSADIPENPIPAVIYAAETEKGCGCGRIIIQDH